MRMVTVKEAAEVAGLPLKVMERLVSGHQVASYMIGTSIKVDADTLREITAAEIEYATAKELSAGRITRLTADLEASRSRVRSLEAALGSRTHEAIEVTEDSRTPVRGFHVYVLRDGNGVVIYVGQSRNVFARLAAHVSGEKRAKVDSVQLLRCGSRAEMCALELSLIGHFRPLYNVAGLDEKREPRAPDPYPNARTVRMQRLMDAGRL